MKYKTQIVLAYFAECGLPAPEAEYKFHPTRKWRFDFAWSGYTSPHSMGYSNSWNTNPIDGTSELVQVCLEVDGGIWIRGGHNRGAQMLKTWEKENEAVCMGWRILRCQPDDLCTQDTVRLIKRALGI